MKKADGEKALLFGNYFNPYFCYINDKYFIIAS